MHSSFQVPKVLIKIEYKKQTFNQCYKTSVFSCIICRYHRSPYIYNVFFIVLDLRLTKDWLSGIDSLFLYTYIISPLLFNKSNASFTYSGILWTFLNRNETSPKKLRKKIISFNIWNIEGYLHYWKTSKKNLAKRFA